MSLSLLPLDSGHHSYKPCCSCPDFLPSYKLLEGRNSDCPQCLAQCLAHSRPCKNIEWLYLLLSSQKCLELIWPKHFSSGISIFNGFVLAHTYFFYLFPSFLHYLELYSPHFFQTRLVIIISAKPSSIHHHNYVLEEFYKSLCTASRSRMCFPSKHEPPEIYANKSENVERGRESLNLQICQLNWI